MKRSESIKEIATALAKAQGEIRPASKDSDNPHYKSRYADLASVVSACREPLAKNGLSIVQEPSTEKADGVVMVRTVSLLMHTSGEWVECQTAIPCQKADAHGIGSAATYGRRYGYAALVGVVADEDDDGNGAAEPKGKKPEKPETKPEALKLNYINELRNTLGTGCHCKTPEQAMAVLKFVLGDEWEKLPNDCTQAEAKDAWDRLKEYGNTKTPMHDLLAEALKAC
jgi:hypothetical protein